MYDPNQIQPMNASQLIDPLTLYRQQNGMATPPIDAQRSGMGLPVGSQIPMGDPQQMSPEIQHVTDTLNQYIQNKTQQQSGNDFLSQILANRIQPTGQDVAASGLNSVINHTYSSPEQQMAGRYQAQLAPFSDVLGLQEKVAQSNLQNAQAGYYNDALARDLAEKRFEYENDPAKAQAKMMAKYMAGLGGMSQPNPTSTTIPVSGVASLTPPQNLSQKFQSNGQQQSAPTQPGGGFNPMGAMLAKSLGLTDMQIGPNGQPMPIPGSMKIENGEVVSFGDNGVPTKVVPKNPVASTSIEDGVTKLSDLVDQLGQSGNAIKQDNSWMQNMGNSISNSSVGLALQPGSKSTDIIRQMSSIIMQKMPDYMQAKGITPGMERSLGGQEMILNAIGIHPQSQSVEAMKAILANISQAAGTGDFAKSYSSPQSLNAGPNPQDIVDELRKRGVVQ